MVYLPRPRLRRLRDNETRESVTNCHVQVTLRYKDFRTFAHSQP
jgi:hypothetical protein